MRLERSGKPMEFLAKLNPKATLRSVVRRALIGCIIAAGLWGLAVVFLFYPKFQPSWWAFFFNLGFQPSWWAFGLWTGLAALVGAVWEWQVTPESDDKPPASENGA
jgi:hypothetical protein